MKKALLLGFIFFSVKCISQTDTSRWVRAFPVTNYIVDLTDSIKLVQVYLPNGPVLKEKQVGTLRSIYRDSPADTGTVGSGRCHLIKGEYYYFTVNHTQSGRTPKEGDLLYTVVSKPGVYTQRLLRLASHFIELRNVYEDPLYDPYTIFNSWTEEDETQRIDSMVSDIRFTGDYFRKNAPAMNVKISGGKYDGSMVLEIMTKCSRRDLTDFLDYMLARPRMYAGHKWKVSEIFATWLGAGAPIVNR